MADPDARYDVRELTQNPSHASVDDVLELVRERARSPRADHQDAHFDEELAADIDRYGEAAIRAGIHRVLVENVSVRTATIDLEMRTIDGVRIGTTAGWFLRALNAAQPQ